MGDRHRDSIPLCRPGAGIPRFDRDREVSSMFRQPILVLRILALASALALPGRISQAQEHAAPAGAAHEEEKPNILKDDVVLALSTLIVFVLLLTVLGKFA